MKRSFVYWERGNETTRWGQANDTYLLSDNESPEKDTLVRPLPVRDGHVGLCPSDVQQCDEENGHFDPGLPKDDADEVAKACVLRAARGATSILAGK